MVGIKKGQLRSGKTRSLGSQVTRTGTAHDRATQVDKEATWTILVNWLRKRKGERVYVWFITAASALAQNNDQVVGIHGHSFRHAINHHRSSGTNGSMHSTMAAQHRQERESEHGKRGVTWVQTAHQGLVEGHGETGRDRGCGGLVRSRPAGGRGSARGQR
jgi:hypothetical protein